VLRLPQAPAAIAGRLGLEAEAFDRRRVEVDAILKAGRDRRPQPLIDDKVIAAWNGLVIAGLADAGRVLREPLFVDAASNAADAVLTTMRGADGGLLRVRREGVSRIPGFLEDYALMAWGLLALDRAEALSEAQGSVQADPSSAALARRRRVDQAVELVEAALVRFQDPHGAFFDTLSGQSDLFVRTRGVEDGAVPSGNSTMLLVLLELHERTGESRWLDLAARSLAALSGRIADHPAASALSVLAIDRMATRHPERLPSADQGVASAAPTITIAADPPEVVVGSAGDGGVAHLEVVLTLPSGIHINAHAPGDPALVGLSIELLDGEGLAVAADYPPGQEYWPPGQEAKREAAAESAAIRVHHGTVRIPVRLGRIGHAPGHPALLVVFQP